MKKFYFTYGRAGQPYVGGWTEIIAEDFSKACGAFQAYHPSPIPRLLNCADIYDEESFISTGFLESGNFNVFCHETITLMVEKKNGSEDCVH